MMFSGLLAYTATTECCRPAHTNVLSELYSAVHLMLTCTIPMLSSHQRHEDGCNTTASDNAAPSPIHLPLNSSTLSTYLREVFD